MKENVLLDKSFAFAIRIVNAYKFLTDERREFVMSKQLLRSGTSIGANAEEAIGGQSTPDFVSKLSIAYKEARETKYWIRLLHATEYFDDVQSESLSRTRTNCSGFSAAFRFQLRKITTFEGRNSKFEIRN